ncbi:TraB/GumN family protein [Pelagerythrobacter sp.]|uniref:TraB/GumN family protein n=1 Tax=Pelagerythrobacter sp. TaxID=2800702 RepID=UPI0035B3712D
MTFTIIIDTARRLSLGVSAISLALAGPAFAQEEVAPAPAAEATVASPALWKVADEDTTIWLFGTVHALPTTIEWYRGPIATALGGSDTLVTEIEMTPATATTMQQIVMTKAILPDGQTLRGLLDDDQRAAYEAAMTKLELPVAAFDRFEPWYGAMTLAMLPLLKQGYSLDAGAEQVLEAQAGETIGRGALETVEEQLELFDGLPQDAQVEFLMETVDGIDDIKEMLDAMVAEWAEGDADALADLMNEGMDDPVLAERLLYARNANWAQWIDERLEAPGTVFVAVGAGHLAGENSVQEKLEDLGIETERVQ